MEAENKEDKLKPLLSDLRDSEDFGSLLSYISNPKNTSWEYIDSSNGNSILHILISEKLFDFSQKVIKIIKDMTKPDIFLKFINHQNFKGINVLHIACHKGNLPLIKLLIEYGVNYRVKGITGLSCVHCAAQTNKVSVIYYLIKKYNIDLYDKDYNGNYFYHWACFFGSEKVIDFFLNDNNFEINIKNNEGNIPLHFYLMKRNKRSIKRLIYRGADAYIRNNKGENSFDIVEKKFKNDDYNKKEIKNILKRNNYFIAPFIIFIFYHFFFAFLIIIFEFPFIEINRIRILYTLYLLWNFFQWLYIFYFLMKPPGIIKPNKKNYLLKLLEDDKENNIDLWNYCIKCQIRKEINSTHCFFCDQCIMEFDHHCLWLKKCIGKNNKKAFCYLIIIILINSILNFILSIMSQVNDSVINFFLFTSFLINNIKVILVIKYIICGLSFILVLFVLIIIIPLIKIYIFNSKMDNIFEQNKKIIENIGDMNENDEKEQLIEKNDNEI